MTAYEFMVKLKDYASNGLRQIASSVGQSVNNVRNLNNGLNNTVKVSDTLKNSWNKLKSLVTSIFAITAIWSFTNKVVEARSEYEKFNAVLT